MAEPETGERATENSPYFVRLAAHKRYALAAGLLVGDSVLDVGCGTAKFAQYVNGWVNEYMGIDNQTDSEVFVNGVREPLGFQYVQGSILDYFHGLDQHFDTVVSLESFEHFPPAHQLPIALEMWRLARRRLIIATPSPEALHYYPTTEHFYGVNNPAHTREVWEWTLRKYIAQAAGVKEMFTLHCALDADDGAVWGDNPGPCADYMLVIDKA